MLSSLWRYRQLVFELSKREFSSRYRGTAGEVLWVFLQPLYLLTVYTLAFAVILKARWSFSGGTAEYVLMLFSGLIVFNVFADCLNKSPSLISGNSNFVKKVVFPLELLSFVTVAGAFFHACIGVGVWCLGYMLLLGFPTLNILFFPLILFCFFPLVLGVSWLLSAFGLIVRDISQLTAMLSHSLLFMTPIFYAREAAPPGLQYVLIFNPLTFIVEQLRLVLFSGQMPMFKNLLVYFACSLVFAWGAYGLFQRLRPDFADLV
ncbi:phosphate ABC transporter permease [Legionella quinlivanii]|uniref:Transport permease protein n=1 Tax=Legionella quinlivanii TaxID=45073 RepID=A0A364LN38_9GAMM|nr:ABC transporter permease [Legionella quinlivanii]RAP38463.1 phosphate ABC transporter permease [Legionella quinlivanii]